MRAAFDKYLRDDGPADVRVDGIEVGEAVELATGLGARVALAHPHTLEHYAIVRELFARYRDAGLEGEWIPELAKVLGIRPGDNGADGKDSKPATT